MDDATTLHQYASRKAQAALEMVPVLVPHDERTGRLQATHTYSGGLLIRFAKAGVTEHGDPAGLYPSLDCRFLIHKFGLEGGREHAGPGNGCGFAYRTVTTEAGQMAVDITSWMSSQAALDAMTVEWERTGREAL